MIRGTVDSVVGDRGSAVALPSVLGGNGGGLDGDFDEVGTGGRGGRGGTGGRGACN